MAPSFLAEPALRLLLFGGKGGVGKTTCAAATALRIAGARSEEAFLLVSTDPAHSLKDCLAGTELPTNLTVQELDAKACLAAFRQQNNAKLREIASRGTFLDDDDIAQFLSLSLPGLDELFAFLEIARWVKDESYACVVVDTAPTGHTLRLLAMPELMRAWLVALDSLVAKHRYMKARFQGRYRPDEIDAFLQDLDRSVRQMARSLRDETRCRFLPVMVGEELIVDETGALLAELRRCSMPVREIIVNRLYPDGCCDFCSGARGRQLQIVDTDGPEWSTYTLWSLPVSPVEVRGKELLEGFWSNAALLLPGAQPALPDKPEVVCRVDAAAAVPSPWMKLLVFAGKGGVGKTTLACATALRLNEEFPDKRILLFSTDPAHSLTACLGAPVGCSATPLRRGLTALAVDAESEFRCLKQLYSAELRGFLESVVPNLDFTYDRQVMERILDLSPPGLDEVMALTKMIQLLEGGAYDLLVLDSAPTGHLIRLLELPDLIAEWLKVLFGVFLKYRQLLRLPKVSERLVDLSRSLKRLHALLADPGRSAVCVVSILTEMAFEETRDLITSCRRMNLNVSQLFLNLATPDSDCPLQGALHTREEIIRRKFHEEFPDLLQTRIERQIEPKGLGPLADLGRALYSHVSQISSPEAALAGSRHG